MQEMFFRRDMSSDNLICKVDRQQHNISTSWKTRFALQYREVLRECAGWSCKFDRETLIRKLTSNKANNSLMYNLRTPRDLPIDARNTIANSSMRKGVSIKENAHDTTVHNNAILLTAAYYRGFRMPGLVRI